MIEDRDNPLFPKHAWLRELRISNDETLLSQGHRLSMEPAELTQIETGKQRMPDGFPDRIIEIYGRDAEILYEEILCARFERPELDGSTKK